MTDRYDLRIAKTAEKDLRNLIPKHFKQVVTKLFSLCDNPRPQDHKQLKGYEGGYRVDQGEYRILYTIYEGGYRVDQGEYRILYTIDDSLKLIDIFRIGKRNDDEVYKNL